MLAAIAVATVPFATAVVISAPLTDAPRHDKQTPTNNTAVAVQAERSPRSRPGLGGVQPNLGSPTWSPLNPFEPTVYQPAKPVLLTPSFESTARRERSGGGAGPLRADSIRPPLAHASSASTPAHAGGRGAFSSASSSRRTAKTTATADGDAAAATAAADAEAESIADAESTTPAIEIAAPDPLAGTTPAVAHAPAETGETSAEASNSCRDWFTRQRPFSLLSPDRESAILFSRATLLDVSAASWQTARAASVPAADGTNADFTTPLDATPRIGDDFETPDVEAERVSTIPVQTQRQFSLFRTVAASTAEAETDFSGDAMEIQNSGEPTIRWAWRVPAFLSFNTDSDTETAAGSSGLSEGLDANRAAVLKPVRGWPITRLLSFETVVEAEGGAVLIHTSPDGDGQTRFSIGTLSPLVVQEGATFYVNAGLTYTQPVSFEPGSKLGGGGTLDPIGGIEIPAGVVVSPGASPGILTVGDITFSADSVLELELGGLLRGLSYDVLASKGVIRADGTLSIVAYHGYAFRNGDVFDILDFRTIRGDFDLLLPILTNSLAWDTSRLYVDGTLRVVGTAGLNPAAIPEAHTLMLLSLGGIALLQRRSKRHPENPKH